MLNIVIFVLVFVNVMALFYFAFRLVTPSLFILFPMAILCFRANDQTIVFSVLYLALAWYVLLLDMHFKNSLKTVYVIKEEKPRLGRYLILACILLVVLFIEGLGGVVGGNKTGGASPFFGLYTSIYTILYIFVFVLFIQQKLNKSQVLVFVSFIILFGIVTNSRGTIGKGVLMLVLVYLYSARTPLATIKRAFPVVLYTLIPLLFVVLATLDRKGISISSDQLVVGFTFFIEQIRDVRGNMVNPGKIQYFVEFANNSSYRLESFYVFAFLYGLVPFFLWPGKPPVSIGQPIGEMVFGSRIDAVGGGVPTDLIGQGIMTFGVEYGLLAGIFLSVFILTLISITFKQFKLIGLPAYVSFGSIFGSDFGRMFIDFVTFVPLYLMVHFLLHVRLKFK